MAWKPRRMVAYSPKARALGKKLREIRECIGLTMEQASDHLGIEKNTLNKYELGYIVPGREMQRRLILYYFGKWSWKSAPAAPAVQGDHRTEETRAVLRISVESQRRLDELCNRYGASAGAIVELALEQLADNTPVLTTLREAARRYEDLRWHSILESNHDLTMILDADPIMARIAHEGLQYTHARDKLLDPKFLLAWLNRDDVGSYMEVANVKWKARDHE